MFGLLVASQQHDPLHLGQPRMMVVMKMLKSNVHQTSSYRFGSLNLGKSFHGRAHLELDASQLDDEKAFGRETSPSNWNYDIL